jgi:putative radical SAM enzyme (TIGR03279 family)
LGRNGAEGRVPIIKDIVSGSIADEGGARPGETLIAINGERVGDVFDYRFLAAGRELEIELIDLEGRPWILEVSKEEDEDEGEGEELGFVFDGDLLDSPRACANKCIFCFVDQMPRHMRQSLYFKDDDLRLSFLNGNYVTLTNVGSGELDRIARYRMSPVNISVHATDAKLRAKMLGLGEGAAARADVMPAMRYLTERHIDVNSQIVLCKGINDGAELDRTLSDLATLNERLRSVSVVPVGLTDHRVARGLPAIPAFDASDAKRVLRSLKSWQSAFLKGGRGRLVFPADEFFLLASKAHPGMRYYEGFPQLENGVGMLALFKSEFDREARALRRKFSSGARPEAPGRVESYVFTGVAAQGLIERCAALLSELAPWADIAVVPVKNAFFGERITVAGLLTGRDILDAARLIDFSKSARVFVPKNMLKFGTELLLDDISLEMLRNELKVDIIAVDGNGRDFARKVLWM